jgi:hypothetical protein
MCECSVVNIYDAWRTDENVTSYGPVDSYLRLEGSLCLHLWVEVCVIQEEQPRRPANGPTDRVAESV